jgi:hypothetical protein
MSNSHYLLLIASIIYLLLFFVGATGQSALRLLQAAN